MQAHGLADLGVGQTASLLEEEGFAQVVGKAPEGCAQPLVLFATNQGAEGTVGPPGRIDLGEPALGDILAPAAAPLVEGQVPRDRIEQRLEPALAALAGQPQNRCTGSSVAEMYAKILTEDPVSPAKRNRGVSRDLDTICMKALSKSPSRRYATTFSIPRRRCCRTWRRSRRCSTVMSTRSTGC